MRMDATPVDSTPQPCGTRESAAFPFLVAELVNSDVDAGGAHQRPRPLKWGRRRHRMNHSGEATRQEHSYDSSVSPGYPASRSPYTGSELLPTHRSLRLRLAGSWAMALHMCTA